MSRMPLMAGNWKMNINHIEAIALVQKLAYTFNDEDYANVDIAVIPPFTDLRSVQTLVDGDKLQLKYGAIIGHSERRQYHGETDDVVNAKAKAALRHDITPIVCVGEGLDIRKEGTHVEYTLAQVKGALAGLSADQIAGLVIAYEPVWAIGTGEVATPEDAQEVCGAIRESIRKEHGGAADKVRILYGGSMKSDNVARCRRWSSWRCQPGS